MPAKQVLIVEDERPIREMIAFGLKRAGFEVRKLRIAVPPERRWLTSGLTWCSLIGCSPT
jgi:hypothetical protein